MGLAGVWTVYWDVLSVLHYTDFLFLFDFFFFFFKQKTAYEILTCDWSSDVCSSDLHKHTSAYGVECRGKI